MKERGISYRSADPTPLQLCCRTEIGLQSATGRNSLNSAPYKTVP